MYAKNLVPLLLLLTLCGCTGPPLKSMTQTVHKNGSSDVVIKFYVEEIGDADSFNASKMFEDRTEPFSEEEWAAVLEFFGKIGINASDPDLQYPENQSEETTQKLAERLSEALRELYYVKGMDLNCTGLLDFNLQNARCYFIKDDPPGESCAISCMDEEVVRGTYVPDRTYLTIDESDPMYITYTYNVLGTVAIILESDDVVEWLNENSEIKMGIREAFGNLTDVMDAMGGTPIGYIFDEPWLMNTSANNSALTQLSPEERAAYEASLAEAAGAFSDFKATIVGPGYDQFTCAIKMPGEIVGTSVGVIENNTVIVPLGKLLDNPQSAYIVSREKVADIAVAEDGERTKEPLEILKEWLKNLISRMIPFEGIRALLATYLG